MANIKGKGQRLIPEELLKYLEDLKKEYPNAVDIVEANPTLEGGEDSLSSVLINGVKYAVGGGSEAHLYRHEIEISRPLSEGKGLELLLQIYTASNNAINSMSLLQQNITNTRNIQCGGWIMNTNISAMAAIVGFNVSTKTVSYAKNQSYPAEYMIENLGTLIYYDTITQIL